MKTKEIILSEEKHDFSTLVSIMDILRSDCGCPWDKVQTHQSIRKCLIEETYEVIEAIDKDDYSLMCEELGDLIFQAVFHAKIESEKNNFDIDDVINGICSKMIRRHPHVFSDVNNNSLDIPVNWDKIKMEEKPNVNIFDVVKKTTPGLPSLLKAQKIFSKVKRNFGFGYDCKNDALDDARKYMDISYGRAIFALAAAAEMDDVDAEKDVSDAIDVFINQCERL